MMTARLNDQPYLWTNPLYESTRCINKTFRVLVSNIQLLAISYFYYYFFEIIMMFTINTIIIIIIILRLALLFLVALSFMW